MTVGFRTAPARAAVSDPTGTTDGHVRSLPPDEASQYRDRAGVAADGGHAGVAPGNANKASTLTCHFTPALDKSEPGFAGERSWPRGWHYDAGDDRPPSSEGEGEVDGRPGHATVSKKVASSMAVTECRVAASTAMNWPGTRLIC